MQAAPVTTDVSNPGRSERAPLLSTPNRNNQFDCLPRAIDLELLAPLLVGMAAVILFALAYTCLLEKLG
jgi:hypothetical protein